MNENMKNSIVFRQRAACYSWETIEYADITTVKH